MNTFYSKPFIFLFVSSFLFYNLDAQKIDIEWEYNFIHRDNNDINIFLKTKDYGLIVGGSIITKVNLNPGIDVYYTEYQIIKLDQNGNEIWQKTYGGESYDDIKQIIETNDGGYLVGGTSESYSSDSKLIDTYGVKDYWIIKLDKNGNSEWQKSYGGWSEEFFGDFVQTEDGGYLLGGSSWSTNNGVKTTTRYGKHDIWIIKIDNLGNIEWQTSYGGSDHDYLSKIIKMDDGGYFLACTSKSSKTGTKSENSNGVEDFWLLGVDETGTLLWQKTLGGFSADYLDNAFVTKDDHVIVYGFSSSKISGDKNSTYNFDQDMWVIKIDFSGKIIWQKSLPYFMNKIIETQDENLALLSNTSFVEDAYEPSSLYHQAYYLVKLNNKAEFESEIFVNEFFKTNYSLLIETEDESFALGGLKRIENLSDPNNRFVKANINVIKIFDDVEIENLINNLNIYPNPFSDFINIDYDKDVSIKMYNSVGQKVIESNSKTIEINNLSQGFYLLHIYNVKGNLISINKLIKKL